MTVDDGEQSRRGQVLRRHPGATSHTPYDYFPCISTLANLLRRHLVFGRDAVPPESMTEALLDHRIRVGDILKIEKARFHVATHWVGRQACGLTVWPLPRFTPTRT